MFLTNINKTETTYHESWLIKILQTNTDIFCWYSFVSLMKKSGVALLAYVYFDKAFW